ncbi:MAG: hypothetical protein JNM51_00780, partial [Bacteroidia bacterium]|nr:hypothetical protein [Bacteroidia bacterium]
MEPGTSKFDLKIFLIDKTYYEFREKNNQEIIDIIKSNHEKKLRHKKTNFSIVKPEISYQKDEEFEYWSYCFNQPKEKFYWKLFLPEELTESQNFDVVEFSFVLFLKYKTEIYCVISGSGMNVIKKFVHPSFGIDIYQRLAKTKEDIIVELNTRGVANNISQKKETFNYNQTIAETIEYSQVPTKIKLKIRHELKVNEFKKYKLDDNVALMEVGSYFYLKKKIDFEELKQLIKDLQKIREENELTQLTLFTKIINQKLLIELDEYLKDIVTDDILSHNNPSSIKYQQDILEVVHPTKLERFYECNKFIIRLKNSRGKTDIETNDRSKLYHECTKHINENLTKFNDRFEAKGKLYNLNIVGYINDSEVTYGNFFAHITAEIEYLNKKYFKIDGHWYILEDDFLSLMNSDAKDYYAKYCLTEQLLLKWHDYQDEDDYNKSHSGIANYYVLDKVIKDNIELCDILIVKDNKVYFVHVKDGFNTKMRDLYIQVILSAKRLSNDLKNNKGVSYLKSTLKEYNSRNSKNQIDYKIL